MHLPFFGHPSGYYCSTAAKMTDTRSNFRFANYKGVAILSFKLTTAIKPVIYWLAASRLHSEGMIVYSIETFSSLRFARTVTNPGQLAGGRLASGQLVGDFFEG